MGPGLSNEELHVAALAQSLISFKLKVFPVRKGGDPSLPQLSRRLSRVLFGDTMVPIIE